MSLENYLIIFFKILFANVVRPIIYLSNFFKLRFFLPKQTVRSPSKDPPLHQGKLQVTAVQKLQDKLGFFFVMSLWLNYLRNLNFALSSFTYFFFMDSARLKHGSCSWTSELRINTVVLTTELVNQTALPLITKSPYSQTAFPTDLHE